MLNELQLLFEWSRRIGGDPQHGHNELHLLRQIARARGHATTHNMNEVSALRAIAASYGKSNVGYMNELDALRAIVDGMDATPSNRNLHDMNEIDCLWAIIRASGAAPPAPPPSNDSDAEDFFTRVVANGGTLSAGTQTAVNTFVVSAKANGYWDKLTRINLFCGDQLAAALVPLKVGSGSATDTNTSFIAGSYTEATGLTANGATQTLDTGVAGNWNGDNDGHFAVYVPAYADQTAGLIGNNAADANKRNGLITIAGSTLRYDYVGTGSAFATTRDGFIAASRTSATASSIYRNAVSLGSFATNGSGATTEPIGIFGLGPGTRFTGAIRGYSIGTGLTSGNVTDYTTDMEVFQDAIGRAVNTMRAWVDDFATFTDGTSMGANWVEQVGSWEIVSGNLESPTGAFAQQLAVRTGAPCATADQYAKITCTNSTNFRMVVFRYTNAASPFYAVELVQDGTVLWYYYADAATEGVQIGVGTAITALGDGDSVGITLKGTGDSTVLLFWKNPTGDAPDDHDTWGGAAAQAFIGDNPPSPVNSGPYIGLQIFQSAANSVKIDKLSGGDIPV